MLKIIIIFLFYFIFVFNLPKLNFYFFYLQMSSGKNFAKVAKLVIVALRLLDSSVAQLTYKKGLAVRHQ